MREIKFRGKFVYADSRTQELPWVYGTLLYIGDRRDKSVINNGYRNSEVLLDTVGQFTGLKDKNGKEIYEGDIVYSEFSDGSNSKCLVGWNEKKLCFGIMDEYAYRSKLEGYDFPKFDNNILFSFFENSVRFEVVGNIFDNLELLKV